VDAERRIPCDDFCRHIERVGAELSGELKGVAERLAALLARVDRLEVNFREQIRRSTQELIADILDASGVGRRSRDDGAPAPGGGGPEGLAR
jgi:hypothetical protein